MTRVAPHRVAKHSGDVRSHRAPRRLARPLALGVGLVAVATAVTTVVAMTLSAPGGDPGPLAGSAPVTTTAATQSQPTSTAPTAPPPPSSVDVVAPPAGPAPTAAPTTAGTPARSNPATGTPAALAGSTMQVYLTGYGFRDNDCGSGSGGDCTAYGDGRAGGTGTYDDPITLAVGSGGWRAGTLAYLPQLQRYVVVEDRCASCGAGHAGLTWIDVWVDGRSLTATAAEQCMNSLTGVTTAQLNPPPGLPVRAGIIAGPSGCQL